MGGRRFKLVPEMEGRVARWYARQRGTERQIAAWRKQAVQLTERLPTGARVLEVAPGPGYLAIEIARLGRFAVSGLDISRTFVEIASDNARRAGVPVDFRRGDVGQIPFEAGSFDLIVCQAAFKNFSEPVRALDEMHRVLRQGGSAVILDLNRHASRSQIAREVAAMQLSWLNAFTTKVVLGTMLRRRAYSPEQFESVVRQSAFRSCGIRPDGIGLEIVLRRG